MRSDEVNAKILEGLTPEARENFLAGLKLLKMDNPADRETLRESIRKLRPDFSEAQIDIFVEGKAKPETDNWMA